jgi:hypothetical protein
MEELQAISSVDPLEYIKEVAKRHGIKPLEGKQTITYIANRFTKDAKNGRVLFPASIQIPVDVTIQDPKSNEPILISYVKSRRPMRDPKTGMTTYIEVREDIFLDNGIITVSAKELPLYYYLELIDQNESKVGRDSSVPAIFYRQDTAKTVRDNINQDDKELYARTSVKNLSKEDLLVVAKKFEIDINREIDLIRWDVMQKAKKDPDLYINSSTDPKVKMQLFVMEAKSWRTIYYDSETRKWILVSKGEEKEFTDEVKVGSNPEEILVEMLMSAEGKPYIKAIKELNKLK